jgi:hypothetical protein
MTINPSGAAIPATSLPSDVVGTKSPYPTEVDVIIISQKALYT